MNNHPHAVLRCQQLSKVYRDGHNRSSVLNDVNLTVNRGDSIAIVGASGCGKSTLLHLLGGLDRATSGEVWWRQQQVMALSEKQRCQQRNRQIGFIYQFHHLLPEFTALENVAMPLLIAGQSPKTAMTAARQLLVAVGLSERIDHKTSVLSGGERQRTAVARALVVNPDCILADEPTGNLDATTATQVLTVMLELRQQLGTALLVVTHDNDLAKQLDRCYQLLDGQLHLL